ncbi:chitin deacetylase [Crepidotus variabilis]|uniref:Chitin deacetylase n=1 Tax=Crepidotus variabilis TaxID=179855 RepID=A0A9P6ERK8_9AGAR|nr:chitin deacetylase [Crepidotus variabilis]
MHMFSLSLLTVALAAFNVIASPVAKNSTLSRRSAAVYSSCTVPNTVALTFDDGPYDYIYDLVNILNGKGVKGTFFFNGNNYRCIYDQASVDRVKYVYNSGHLIGSHTWAHKDLTTLSWDQIHDEMWRVEQAVSRITGAYVAFMRPPYGNYNQQVLDASGIRGQSVATWDFDSQDSLGASPQTSEQLYDQLISRHPSTILALNHETISTTVYQVIGYAIDHLKGAGYNLVTLNECLGLPAYQYVGAPAQRDSSWTC